MVGTVIKVISTGANRWHVEGESAGEVLSGELEKSEALELAQKIAKDRGGQLIVIGESGQVEREEEFDYGEAEPVDASSRHEITIPTVSVVQDDAGRWLVEGGLPEEILAGFAAKDDAIAFARAAASARRAQLIVHLPDGNIEWTEDYAWWR